MADSKKPEPTWHVLKKSLGGGPHGLGDPEDKTLRKAESKILIPNKMKEIARKEKCHKPAKAFGECASAYGIAMAVRCRKQADDLKLCMLKWLDDPDFQNQCKEAYLEERSEYRATGIGLKYRKNMEAIGVKTESEPET